MIELLAKHNIEPYQVFSRLSVVVARVPSELLHDVVRSLLQSPRVAYVEPNRHRPVFFSAGPTGSNPADLKHDVHEVQEAWDHTRGDGAKVGILDSGFTGGSHSDGDGTQNWGLRYTGFSDDYGSCNPSYGNCEWRDDHGHGTSMAGLVGANDNDVGHVGVMPFGKIYSMKIAINCNITGCSEDTWTIDDNAWQGGLNWAINQGLDVLSMSFSAGGAGLGVLDALYDAYHSYDILLLSSTGNTPEQAGNLPASLSYVMGVGGVSGDSSDVYQNEDEEVSGYAGGWTTVAACSGTDFCSPDGWETSGGTSAATANVAGIAGLIRSFYPSLTAPDLRDRLVDWGYGPNKIVNAEASLMGAPPTVVINGPIEIPPGTNCHWNAAVSDSDGGGPYTYEWYHDGQLVSTSSGYTGSDSEDFDLNLKVWDRFDRFDADLLEVTVSYQGRCMG